ncbi:MAG: hypothetical protein IKI21_08200 [Oscillospiraceae bacterium]|nr:hypothetical protein [Oscillospiraceae bacterium]
MKRVLTVLFFVIVAILEGLITFAVGLVLSADWTQTERLDPTTLAMFLMLALCTLISIGGIVFAAFGTRGTLVCAGLLQLTVFAGGITAFATLEPPFVLGANLTLLLLTVLLGIGSGAAIWHYRNKAMPTPARAPQTVPMSKQTFTALKAKWGWDDAAREYSAQTGRDSADYTDADETQVMRYAAAPIAYLLVWLNDHYLYESATGDEAQLDAIRRRVGDPVAYLLDVNDGVLVKEEIAPRAHDFLDWYCGSDPQAQRLRFTTDHSSYPLDYAAVMDAQGDWMYAVPFSWDIAEAIGARIERAYRLWRGAVGHRLVPYGERIRLPYFETGVMMLCEEDVPERYRETVAWRLAQDRLLLRKAIEQYDPALAEDWDTIGQTLHPSHIELPYPIGRDPAAIVYFETEGDPEHGFAYSFRGDRLVSSGDAADVVRPWSAEADRILQQETEAPPELLRSVTTDDDRDHLIARGSLMPMRLPDGDTVFLPPCRAAQLREALEMCDLLTRHGLADPARCMPRMRPGHPVPFGIEVTADRGQVRIFHDFIRIW